MIQFYDPHIESKGLLGPEESVHCVRVLRKKSGDEIFVTDGKGKRFRCIISEASTRGVKLDIIDREIIEKNWNFEITLAVAPTKNADRMSWLVEKATEIGVDRIVFLKCEHSERKAINIERLKRNAISAMNQSLKTVLPVLEGPETLHDFVSNLSNGGKYFGYCDEKEDRIRFVDAFVAESNTVLCIGPEGDFSPGEVLFLKQRGFLPVTFGDERLRTETAAIYGVCGIHILNDKK